MNGPDIFSPHARHTLACAPPKSDLKSASQYGLPSFCKILPVNGCSQCVQTKQSRCQATPSALRPAPRICSPHRAQGGRWAAAAPAAAATFELLGGVESAMTPTASSGDDSPWLALRAELRLAIFAGAFGEVGAGGMPGSGWPKGTLPLFFTDTGLVGKAGPPEAGLGEEAPERGGVPALGDVSAAFGVALLVFRGADADNAAAATFLLLLYSEPSVGVSPSKSVA